MRKKMIDEIGLLDEAFYFYGEDKDYCMRCLKAGWELFYIPSAKVIHYGGASSSMMSKKYFLHLQQASLQLWKKHFRPYKVTFFVLMRILTLFSRYLFAAIQFLNQNEDNIQKKDLNKSAILWFLNGTPLIK